MQNVSYDPVKGFAPISLIGILPNVLVVHPSLPVKSVLDLIELARAHPGKLNYATAGTGGSPHLATALFTSMAHIDIVRVQYRGAAPALNDLIAGEVQIYFPNAAAAVPVIKTGRLRALAVTSAQRTTVIPNLPTIAESGLVGYESVAITGLFAPAATPAPLIERLSRETTQVINREDTKQKLLSSATEAVGGSPDQMAAAMKSDMTKTGKIIKEAGIRVQ